VAVVLLTILNITAVAYYFGLRKADRMNLV